LRDGIFGTVIKSGAAARYGSREPQQLRKSLITGERLHNRGHDCTLYGDLYLLYVWLEQGRSDLILIPRVSEAATGNRDKKPKLAGGIELDLVRRARHFTLRCRLQQKHMYVL
jgi:hypothetical protein